MSSSGAEVHNFLYAISVVIINMDRLYYLNSPRFVVQEQDHTVARFGKYICDIYNVLYNCRLTLPSSCDVKLSFAISRCASDGSYCLSLSSCNDK